MKILSLTLVHFARVFSGLRKTKVEIDFTDVTNKVNLFVGDNGTGKTSIMSCLHPFAYNTVVGDNTNNSDLIMEGKDGKKIINILSDDNHIYEIVHMYTRKKDESIAVKSYIKEDGIELNESGIISSFKSIVWEKIGIDQTYLTLLSIGNTVKGFVEFTAADRKNYATKIFSELEVYSKYYKNITSMDRSMKVLLNSVTSKLSKYSNIDRDQLRLEVESKIKELDRLNIKQIENSKYLGAIQQQLSSYNDIMNQYYEFEKELTNTSNELTKNQSLLTMKLSKEELQIGYKDISNKIQDLIAEQSMYKTEASLKLDMKQSKVEMLESTTRNLDKFNTESSLDEMIEYQKRLEDDIKELRNKYDLSITSPLYKDELVKAVIYLDELKNICDNFLLSVVDLKGIVPLVEKYKKNHNIGSWYQNQYEIAVAEVQNYHVIVNSSVSVSLPVVRHECTDENCPYKAFYELYASMIKNNVNQNDQKIKDLESKVSNYLDKVNTIGIIERCYNHIETYHKILDRCGDFFDKDSFISLYMEHRMVYQVEKASNIISSMEAKERLEDLQSKLYALNDKINFQKSNESIHEQLEMDKERLNKDIEELNKDYRNAKDKFDSISLQIEEYKSQQDSYDREIETVSKIDEIKKAIENLSNNLRSMDSDIKSINELKEKQQLYQSNASSLATNIYMLTTEKDQKSVILSNIQSLEREEIEIREKYDVISNIRMAVSPTTGIPLEFIDYYVKEEMIGRINVLLNSVYHGRFLLVKDQVTIDDKEFTIPYVKNGTLVRDISRASDGERAILSIAFSLVLIQLSCKKYNIMLLDEIDTALDTGSRSKFIDMIEEYMNIIHADQLFLISHNNMFDSYPVNVILLSDYQSFNYSNAHIMRIY